MESFTPTFYTDNALRFPTVESIYYTPVKGIPDGDSLTIETLEVPEPDCFWSVYTRDSEGIATCVADLDSEFQAMTLTKLLCQLLKIEFKIRKYNPSNH